MSQTSSTAAAFDTQLRMALVAMVRKRVPESEVEDIVQATLTEAFMSPHAPQDVESLRRWIFGVAKNKVVDYHRRQGRLSYDLPEVADAPAPHVEQDMLRWAERHLPDGDDAKKTLDWMIREGDGEKLETIAEGENLPAPRVRQRVSRLRRHLKDHWQKEVAILAALGVLITGILLWLRHEKQPEPIAHDPKAIPFDPNVEPIRKAALQKCAAGDYEKCIEGLDQAKRLDPAGDTRPEVQEARKNATQNLNAPPIPTVEPPAPVPTSMLDSDSSTPTPPVLQKATKEAQKMEDSKSTAKPQATSPTKAVSPKKGNASKPPAPKGGFSDFPSESGGSK